MKGFKAFIAKEIRELIRTKRLMILFGIFVIIGIMNAAIAKLTPKFLEMMAKELEEQGITLGAVNVTSMDAWSQFVKNIPTALIVLLIMFGGIYTSEYSKGTLIPLLTKGLSRSTVVLSKLVVMLLSWSLGLWLCFGITYFYSGFYWDNSVVHELFFGAFCWWLFGTFLISCIVFFSSIAGSAIQVILGTGAVYFVMTLIGMFSKVKKYLPVILTDTLPLYKGELEPKEYYRAVIITVLLSLILVVSALPLTHKRQL
jgi:ABC-2 type transport system permease protein